MCANVRIQQDVRCAKTCYRKIPCVATDRTYQYEWCFVQSFIPDNNTSSPEEMYGVGSLNVHMLRWVQGPVCESQTLSKGTWWVQVERPTTTIDASQTNKAVVTVARDNIGTINNNNVTINCTQPKRRNRLGHTDLDAVVALILKDPAIPIGATKRNTSPRTLQNSFRRYRQESQCPRYPRKGTNMRVIKMAKRCKCAKLRASTVSSTIITESLPTIKPQYFGPQPIKRNDRVRQAISRVVQNKGGYVEKQHPRDGLNRSLLKKWTKRQSSNSENSSCVLATQRIWSHRTFRCDVFPTQSTLRRQALVEKRQQRRWMGRRR
jgi:hypothetical protein